ncbi:hypothetical protein BSL78_17255 [Apostichopus japonicus]|uniref:MULE transposase domain-containing protein n=1 Tax=Stichopus japonicus TaxID=307972 RepID=A0A2G8KCZ6_STIJA|nr:hypothetical protein BSL78_17255 [Apostichopus japonicus]
MYTYICVHAAMETCSTDNPCANLQLESCPRLEPILPKLGYEYKVCSYKEHGTSGMDCTLRLCLTEKADVLKWLKDLEDVTETTWRTSKTYPVSQHKQKNVFRVDLHCHHNTRPKSSTADLRKGSKKLDAQLLYVHIGEGYPTVISLKWTHNHETSSADALRERDVNSETRQKLLDLFKSGHSPSSALDTIKYDLQVSCTNEEYTRLSADRSCCPDLQYCYRVFYHKFKTHYGDTGGEKMMLFLDNKNGPDVLMTDDSTSLRLALHNVYPESVLLLCTFHLLQAMWRWLWDSKHKVEKKHRPLLLNSFKTLVYAETEADLQHKLECVTLDPVAQKYCSFITHVQETYERRVSWSMAHRQDLRINTTAYCEAAMRILKDKIFYRLKAFNVCQLTDFILTRFEDYNIRKSPTLPTIASATPVSIPVLPLP